MVELCRRAECRFASVVGPGVRVSVVVGEPCNRPARGARGILIIYNSYKEAGSLGAVARTDFGTASGSAPPLAPLGVAQHQGLLIY